MVGSAVSGLDAVLLAIIAGLICGVVAAIRQLLEEREALGLERRDWTTTLRSLNARLAKAIERRDLFEAELVAEREDAAIYREASVIALQEYMDKVATLTPSPQTYTEAEIQWFKDHKCAHCGGAHEINCPRVRRIKFRGDGETPEEVEYWLDWPTDRVTFIEDIVLQREITGSQS